MTEAPRLIRNLTTFCISHSKDVDGIGAAALVVAAKHAHFKLTGYDNIIEDLDLVPEGTDEFILCDIGTDQSRVPIFVEKLRGLKERCSVTYIDHHYLDVDARRKLRMAGVRLVHDVRECASMLTYKTLKAELPQEAKNIALYGAVTDYMDNSPMAKKMMERSERHSILLEATLLSSAMAAMGDEPGYSRLLVEELSKMKQPHEIDDVPGNALEQMKRMSLLARDVKRMGRKMDRIAYVETDEQATGNVAKLLLGAFDAPVGVAFREKNEKGWFEVSFRGTPECRAHLGRIIGSEVGKYGGSGGGHRLSAGCRIPKERLAEFLRWLDKKV